MSITFGTVIISNNPEESTDWGYSKPSQQSKELENGAKETFSSGSTMIRGVIDINYIKKEEFQLFKNWITNVVNFSQYTFDIVPPSFLDLGFGEGVTIENVYFDGSPDTATFTERVGVLGRHNISFPYSVAKPIDTSLVDVNGVIAS